MLKKPFDSAILSCTVVCRIPTHLKSSHFQHRSSRTGQQFSCPPTVAGRVCAANADRPADSPTVASRTVLFTQIIRSIKALEHTAFKAKSAINS